MLRVLLRLLQHLSLDLPLAPVLGQDAAAAGAAEAEDEEADEDESADHDEHEGDDAGKNGTVKFLVEKNIQGTRLRENG